MGFYLIKYFSKVTASFVAYSRITLHRCSPSHLFVHIVLVVLSTNTGLYRLVKLPEGKMSNTESKWIGGKIQELVNFEIYNYVTGCKNMFEQLHILHVTWHYKVSRYRDYESVETGSDQLEGAVFCLYHLFTDLHLRRILPGFSVGPKNPMVLLQCFRNLLTCNFCAAQKHLKKLKERNLQWKEQNNSSHDSKRVILYQKTAEWVYWCKQTSRSTLAERLSGLWLSVLMISNNLLVVSLWSNNWKSCKWLQQEVLTLINCFRDK